MKKIVIATDSFKGSLSAPEACAIIARQAELIFPEAEVVRLPISDGGDGLIDALLSQLNGVERWVEAEDPLGRPKQVRYAVFKDGSALIEMAGAGGLTLLKAHECNPMRTSTYGVGLVILNAIKNDADPIYVGLGGSATVDGGTGAAAALGLSFLNENEEVVLSGKGLEQIQSVDSRKLSELNYTGKIIFLTDVTNPLCGPNGAAAVFGPQKGATPEQVARLNHGLENLAERIEQEAGIQLRDVPGMGAAGGFALPFVAFMRAEIRRGIDFVLDSINFDQILIGAELVVTGEGRTDAQSTMGKAISAVAARASAAGARVGVISGSLGPGSERMFNLGVKDLVQAMPDGQSLQYAMENAAENLERAAYDYFCRLNADQSIQLKN